MDFIKLPENSEKLLLELIQADNPVQMLGVRFEQASQRDDDELRGMLRELRERGYINVQWADNVPYYLTLTNSARTYREQLAEYEAQKTAHFSQKKKVSPIIFISHRSTDKAIADMLLDFFSGTGIPRETVFCSSLPGNDINERIESFGDRWMAEGQIRNIQQWEIKHSLDSTLSSNYGTSLQFLIQNNLVHESSWTSYGNPREYSLYPSIRNLLFNCPKGIQEALQAIKDKHYQELPF